MSVDVSNLLQIEFAATDFKVSRRKDTNVQRLPIIDEHPLSEVKFFRAFDAKWSLNILLHYLLLSLLRIFQDISQKSRTVDA